MTTFDYDVIVIGTGPGGEGAAMQAVKGGNRVAVVERYKGHRRELHSPRDHSQQDTAIRHKSGDPRRRQSAVPLGQRGQLELVSRFIKACG